ncbi:MAG: hypothetical protein WBG02_06520 [Candidatus Acidiferrum sp.]
MDAVLVVLIFVCVGVWVLVFTIKSSIKNALTEVIKERAALAEDSTLQEILAEIENLDIKRKEEPES